MKNYYEILGLDQEADEKAIKKAFRALSIKYHPDKNPGDKASEETFKEISEAYNTLSDAQKRQAYDMSNTQIYNNANPQDQINEILRQMGININFGGRANKQGQQRFQVHHQVSISLYEAVFGCEKNIKVPSYINCQGCNGAGGKREKCHKCNGAGYTEMFLGAAKIPSSCVTCNGSGSIITATCSSCNQEGYKKSTKQVKVKIPAGIQQQTAMHVPPDINDKCEIYIIINVEKHSKINRNGATLFSTEIISCLDALVGGKKKIETIDGHYDLIIPPGTQQGAQLTIEGCGGILSSGRAHHIVNIHIDIPTNLSAEQIKQIEEIRNNRSKN
jgi:molecular chaperone DnaJ